MTTAIVRYDATLHARAGAWISLPLDERRRRATAAAQTKDAGELWSLLETFLATYSDAGATISRHTLRAYRCSLQVFVADATEQGMSLIRPARDTGARWVRSLEARGLAPATVQIRLAAVRMLYRALRWAGATKADPFADVRPARDPTAPWEKRSPYQHADVEKLLAVAGLQDQVLILLCAHAGLRVSEAIALRWEDIDPAMQLLTVQQGKGRKRRRVLMSTRLLPALVALEGAEGRILPYSDVRARARLRRSANAPACHTRLCTRSGTMPAPV